MTQTDGMQWLVSCSWFQPFTHSAPSNMVDRRSCWFCTNVP